MTGSLLSVVFLLIPALGDVPSSSDAAYEEAKAEAAPGAEGQVALALWCEAQGRDAQRRLHLEQAVALDPENARARGLMGRVKRGDEWLEPAEAARRDQGDAKHAAQLEQYRQSRNRLEQSAAAAERTVEERAARFLRSEMISRTRVRPDLAGDAGDLERAYFADDAAYKANVIARFRAADSTREAHEHVKLGLWCVRGGLYDEARAEFATAVHLDSHIEDAWKKLGYVRYEGHWLRSQEVTALQAEKRAQREATRRWEPVFIECRTWLKDDRRRPDAEARLDEVDDPRAVVALERILCDTPDNQARVIRILARINHPESTRLLTRLAIYSTRQANRRAATAALAGRPARDYGDQLINAIHAPIRYEVVPVKGPAQNGKLVVDTRRYLLVRTYEAPDVVRITSPYAYFGYDVNGLPVAVAAGEGGIATAMGNGTDLPGVFGAKVRQNLAAIEVRTAMLIDAANIKAARAQRQLQADVVALETANETAPEINERVIAVLQTNFDAPDLKDDEDAWRRWWFDRVGYRYTPASKVYMKRTVRSIPPPLLSTSCFAAGTLVRMADGPRAIDSIRPGDRVLSQDVATGALAFAVTMAVHHNPPTRTVRLRLENGEVLVPSTYHCFWVAGKGWSMARELKDGDTLRTLDGLVKVAAAEPGDVVPVFNLDVDASHSYFVGDHGALVHDNTLPDETVRPFDALAAGPVSVPVASK